MSRSDVSGDDSAERTGSTRSTVGRLLGPVDPVFEWVVRFLFGSAFRFLILVGIVFITIGAAASEGTMAGHMGLYGVTSILVGVVGLAISRWKVKQG